MERTNAFDFLRLIAALTVVVGHTIPFLDISFFNVSKESGYFFYHGVPMFFIMSGFLIYKSYERSVTLNRPVWHYYVNRLLRIAPAIYVYLVIIVFVFLFFGLLHFSDFTSIPVIGWIASHFVLIPVYHPSIFDDFGVGVVNGSLWTIPAEFSFYLVVPLLFLLEKRFKFKKMITILFVISILTSLLLEWFYIIPGESMFSKFYKITFLPHLLYFTLGIFWAKVWNKVPKNWGYFCLSLSLFILADVYLAPAFDNFLIKYFFNVLWAVALSYTVIFFGFNAPHFFGKLTNKIGDLSFGVYIWHMIVINSFLYFNVKGALNISDLSLHLLIIAISMVLAYLSWNFIEKPALRLKPYSSRNQLDSQNVSKNTNKETSIRM